MIQLSSHAAYLPACASTAATGNPVTIGNFLSLDEPARSSAKGLGPGVTNHFRVGSPLF